MAMFKLARLAKKIHFSGLLREALRRACKAKGCAEKIVRRPVQTRWNSTTRMIGDALDVKPALQVVYNTTSNKLGRWALKESEWKALKDLHSVLGVSGLHAHLPLNDLTTRSHL